MKRFWLLFSQSVTVALGAYFVVATLQPGWLARGGAAPQAAPLAARAASGPAPAGSLRVAARTASAAVVSVHTSKSARPSAHSQDPWFRFFFGDRGQDSAQVGLGSGVIVDARGYVLTNNHVVEGADEIDVSLNDGRQARAQVIGTDPEADLAVLRLKLDRLPVIELGDSNSLQVGDAVLAIGNPFGVGQTVTSGIVSALGRNQLGINTFENFIQTDAAINPGNSGGALVDVQGRLLGINTAIYSRSGGNMGIGFAIPVATARQVLQALLRDGQVTRGWIGVEPNELTPELAQTFGVQAERGVIITGVLQKGPADRGGMQPGDVVTQVADQAVHNVPELLGAVAALKPGTAAHIDVLRAGRTLKLVITPGKRPRPSPQSETQP